MTSRAGVLPSSPLVRRCMHRCQRYPCPRSPVRCRSEACHEAKGWASPVPTTTLAAARTSNVLSTCRMEAHISETLFPSVQDSIQLTDWDPFERPEPARMSSSWEFLSLPNCAVEVFVHARWHGLVVLIGNVFAYHLRVQKAVTANTATPLVAGEDVRTPLGAFRVVFGVGHFNKFC